MKFTHLFVVTYGRSGSTLLTGILNTIPNCYIGGENNNFLYGLYQTWRSLRNKRLRKLSSENVDSAWRNYDHYNLDEYNVFVRRVLESFLSKGLPNDLTGPVCLGFKEIRWFDRPDQFESYMDFLVDVFPGACLVFNTRDHDAVIKSGWWQRRPPENVRTYLSTCDSLMSKYHEKAKSKSILIVYEKLIQVQSDQSELARLFDFLGEKITDATHDAFRLRYSYRSRRRDLDLSDRPPHREHEGYHRIPFLFNSWKDKEALQEAIATFLEKYPFGSLTRALRAYELALNRSTSSEESNGGYGTDIWTYWDQGLDAAPPVVLKCIRRWIDLNPECRVRVLTKTTVGDFFPSFRDFLELPIAAFTDVLRVNLLARYGGVWTDATVFPMVPLRWWLPAAARKGFFAFSWGTSLLSVNQRDLTVPSWFLSADMGNRIVGLWRQSAELRARELLAEKPETFPVRSGASTAVRCFGRDNYVWLHKEFTRLVREDLDFRRDWEECFEFPASLPFLVGVPACGKSLVKDPSAADRRIALTDRLMPMLKLTYKFNVVRVIEMAAANTATDGRKFEEQAYLLSAR